MGGGRYFQEAVSSLCPERDNGDNPAEREDTPGTVKKDSEAKILEDQEKGSKIDCATSGTGTDAMDKKLETNFPKSSECPSSVDSKKGVESKPGERSKLLPKKRSRRPPVPLGEVKYPTREVLKYSLVIVGIRGTICRQDVDENATSEALFEDIRVAWNTWKAVGVQIALVTNSISFSLAKCILGDELFSCVVQFFEEEQIGPLDLPDTYIAMAKKLQSAPNTILFAGSVYEHVAAAAEAGLQVAIVVRYDNPPLPRDVRYKMCTKLTHLIPASLLIDRGGYISSEGSTTSC